MVDLEKCMSIKSRHEKDVQCPHPRKYGEYCGVHGRSTKVIRIDTSELKSLINISFKKRKDSCDSSEISEISEPEEIKSCEFYEDLDYLDKIDANQLNYDKLLKTLLHYKIQISGSAVKMHRSLVNFLKCQHLIEKAYHDVSLCNNTNDFCAFEDLIDIPKDYLFIFLCQDGMLYGLDLRSLNMYFQELDDEGKLMDRPVEYINPYNRFGLSSNTIYNFQQRLKELQVQNKPIKHPDTRQGPEDTVYFKTLQVFHTMYNQGYPVDANWFLNMSALDLYDLYAVLEDLWNRRLNLTLTHKRRITPNDDNLFNVAELERLKQDRLSKLPMQTIMIDKIEKLTCSGLERDDRTQGIHYFLMALGEVVDIGDALPF